MIESYNTIYRDGIAEFIMKRSKFIAYVKHVRDEEAALSYIDQIRKKHYDATHNCTAYRIGTSNIIERFNDDGEPSQTAGMPILNVLVSKDITNVLVVVTRYFGGTLLGTGGLVKAYKSSTIEGLNASTIINKKLGQNIEIKTDYNTFGRIQHFASTNNYSILDTQFLDVVITQILIPPSDIDFFIKNIKQFSSGKALINKKEKLYYAIINNKIELFT